MRLGDLTHNCGCADRKFIMFEAGKMGLTEAAILVIAVTSLLAARKVGSR